MKNKQFQRLFDYSLPYKRQILTLVTLITFSFALPIPADEGDTVFFILRHAEKTGAAEDPQLSPEGLDRAETLATLLSDAGISAIHSTNYNRTRATIEPLGHKIGLKTRLYDPSEPETFLQRLQVEGGRHVIAGHSNTVPEMVKLLGADPGSEINEDGEFDRIYIITLRDGQAGSVLLRYGKPFIP